MILAPIDDEAGELAVMEFIRSSERFAPVVGQVYTRALEIQRDRQKAIAEREYYSHREPGFIAYTPNGQRMQADEDGVLRPVPEPPIGVLTEAERHWVTKLLDNLNLPRVIAKRWLQPTQRIGNVIPIRGERDQ